MFEIARTASRELMQAALKNRGAKPSLPVSSSAHALAGGLEDGTRAL